MSEFATEEIAREGFAECAAIVAEFFGLELENEQTPP